MSKKTKWMQKDIGRYKTWMNRLATYLVPLNFSMILYLYVLGEPLGITWQVWTVVLFVFLVFILIFDVLVVFPSEQRYTTQKNPEWVELRDDVKDIKEILKGRE